MSRRIGEDFDEFVKFLSKYSLTSYASAPQQIEACKGMHKKLFGLLVFNAEFKIQGSYPTRPFFWMKWLLICYFLYFVSRRECTSLLNFNFAVA